MLSQKVQILHDTVRKMLNLKTDRNLQNILDKAKPEDIAYCLRHFDPIEQEKVIRTISSVQKEAEVISELDVDLVPNLLERLGLERTVEILANIYSDDSADILNALPADFRKEVLSRLKPEESQEVTELIRHKPESAGGIMSPEIFTLDENMTVAEAIAQVQEHREMETIFYPYVVNSEGLLVGVLSLKKLLLVSPQAQVKEVMDKDPVRVQVHEDQEEVARIVARYNYVSVPVVDESNRLVGVVTVDDVLDVMRDQATGDILLLAGAGKESIQEVPFWKNFKTRLPAIVLALVGGLIASEVIAKFSSTLLQTTVLVGFIPVVLSLSGNIGLQTMTIVVRGLAIGRLNFRSIGDVFF